MFNANSLHLFLFYSFFLIIRIAFGIDVDLYQHMENGKDGDTLTPALMIASTCSRNDNPNIKWEKTGTMWVSSGFAMQLPDIVSISGQKFSVQSKLTWKYNDKYERNFVRLHFGTTEWGSPYRDRLTVGCFLTPGTESFFTNQHDVTYP